MIGLAIGKVPDWGWYAYRERTTPGWLDITIHGGRIEVVISVRVSYEKDDNRRAGTEP